MSGADWRVERDERTAHETRIAQFLVGKTISSATVRPHMDECDGSNVLRLTFTDGAVVDITGGYGGYTGRSCDEYTELIEVRVL